MSNQDQDINKHDYPIPADKYDGDLPGKDIRHNSTSWRDKDGNKHRESYNYDENGYMENFHDDRGPR